MDLTDTAFASQTQAHALLSRIDFAPRQLPVIASSPHQPLPGLRLLREEVKRDRDALDSFLRGVAHPPALSANAPYLIAVWAELVHARQPVAIYRMFSLSEQRRKQGKKPPTRTVKVDVVSENGARWVRVNTIKNARLMMELREIDSYLTSEDESGPGPAQMELDNSVLRMARDLLAAAKANPLSVSSDSNSTSPAADRTIIPLVTMRLTRLDPREDNASDPRIGKTIQRLRDMGIDVQLGEWPYTQIQKTLATHKPLESTTDVNLDLSALIALVSDISHSPLPQSHQEALTRFVPPKNRVQSIAHQSQSDSALYDPMEGETDGFAWENSGQHSRALAAQTVQEMNKGILEEIHEHLSVVGLPLKATFWTTHEARHRCLQIVSKIGGNKERQRADALLQSTVCRRTPSVSVPVHIRSSSEKEPSVAGDTLADTYWEHSRYPIGFLPLTPVHVYPSILPGGDREERQPGSADFFDALVRTCSRILPHEAVATSIDPLPAADDILGDIPPTIQTSLPKLTAHTVRSMLAGASRGYTTLTTNRSSVKAILKEMQRAYGRNFEYGPASEDVEKAALWTLDPRSLSESMLLQVGK